MRNDKLYIAMLILSQANHLIRVCTVSTQLRYLFWDFPEDILKQNVIEKINRMQNELMWLLARDKQWVFQPECLIRIFSMVSRKVANSCPTLDSGSFILPKLSVRSITLIYKNKEISLNIAKNNIETPSYILWKVYSIDLKGLTSQAEW